MTQNKKEKNQITIREKDIEIKGLVQHRSAWNYKVEITSPVQNLSGGYYIFVLARGQHSFEGAEGDRCIRQTLLALWELGQFLVTHRERLVDLLQVHDAEIAQRNRQGMSRDKFLKEKKRLKRQLAAGEIDNKVYQKLLTPIRKQHEKFAWEIHHITDSFMKQHIEPGVTSEQQAQVLAILRGEKEVQSPTK